MESSVLTLIDRLAKAHSLAPEEYRLLLTAYSEETAALLRERAVAVRKEIYGNKIFVRGLIEISSYCKNDCLYCGLRRSNRCAERYRLSEEDILECCREGYRLGLRTFVLQGGEDAYFSDDVVEAIARKIKAAHPDCALTLSLGERSRESYARLRAAGADRYLLRHETADSAHYARLHPKELTLKNRMRCLSDLHALGYQTGCGIMVGSPGQTVDTLVKDLLFIERFQPEMCGVGPFIPHHATPFRDEAAGSVDMTCYLLSIIRLICPTVLLPATTALGTLEANGREKGVLSGANVIMPNLSPLSVRKKYELYNGKPGTGQETAEGLEQLKESMLSIGYEIVTDRGDVRH